MGFKEGDFPPVNPPEFLKEPLRDRVRTLATHWAEYGFGTPKMVHTSTCSRWASCTSSSAGASPH